MKSCLPLVTYLFKVRLIGQCSYQVDIRFVNCSVWLAVRRLVLSNVYEEIFFKHNPHARVTFSLFIFEIIEE
jgi:hypothetical protein